MSTYGQIGSGNYMVDGMMSDYYRRNPRLERLSAQFVEREMADDGQRDDCVPDDEPDDDAGRDDK